MVSHFLYGLLGLFIGLQAFASPLRTTYQAKIIKPDGYPLQAASVNFRFTILDPSASCVLYVEDFTAINMTDSAGLISFSLGSGVRSFPTSGTSETFANVFNNATTSYSCQTPGIYTPAANDNRKVVMQFQDANGWQTLPAMIINAVPYAMYAWKSDNATLLNGKADSAFVQYSTIPTCTASQALQYNGASFQCITAGGGTSYTVTASDVTNALGYTPVDPSTLSVSYTTQASFTTVTSTVSSLGSSVTTLTSQVNNLGSSITALSSSVDTLTTSMSALVSSVSSITSSQWATSGSTISYTAGGVGVGTNNPLSSFSVGDGTDNSEVITLNAQNYAWYGWYLGGVRTAFIQSSASEYSIYSQTSGVPMAFYTSSAERMRISASGSVGIGRTNPVTKLDVNGGIRIGMEAATCAVSYTGTLRYNSGNVEYCNGTTWSAFGVSGAGLQSLNGSTSGTQSLVIGTAGNAPAFVTANGVHTLDIPLASAGSVTAGLLSNADYVAFSNKITSSAASVAQVLGYIPASATALGNYLVKANNLSDVVSASAARNNLGVGYVGTLSSVDLGSSDVTGTLAIARTPAYAGDVSKAAASATLTLSNTGVTAGTYTKVTVDTKGRITSSSALASSDVTTALGYTPAASGSFTSSQWVTSGTIINYMNGKVGVGTDNPAAKLDIIGSSSIASQTPQLSIGDSVTAMRLNVGVGTDAGGNKVTWFQSTESGVSNDRNLAFQIYGGNVGIGTTTPTAKFHLAAGTASNASLKFTSGALLTSPQAGSMEYDGFNYYVTDGSNVRRTIATGSSQGSIDNVSNINSTGHIVMTPNNGSNSVIVSSTVASTSSNTGALVVNGGLGVAGNINASGSIVTSANIQGVSVTATSGMIAPYIAGSIVSGGSLTLDSTTHANKGNILLAPNGGHIGLGTTNPDIGWTNQIPGSAGSTFATVTGGPSNIPAFQVWRDTNSAFGGYINLLKSRNGAAAQNNDEIGYLNYGFLNSGNKYKAAGSLVAKIISNADSSETGALILRTTTSGAVADVMTLVNNNVGIGTANPTSPLEVFSNSGYFKLTGTSVKKRIVMGNQDSGGVNNPAIIESANGFLAFGGGNSWSASDGGTMDYTMMLADNGNVGIGTMSPSERLEVSGAIKVPGVGQIGPSGGFGYAMYATGTNNFIGQMYGASTGIQFTSSSGANTMFIQDSGNVGIGTANPAARLDVAGGGGSVMRVIASSNAVATPNVDSDFLLRLMPQNGTGEGGHLEFKGSGGYQDWVIDNVSGELRFFEPNQSRITANTRGGITFMVNTSSTSTPSQITAMKVASGGQIGMGTTTPSAPLHVVTPGSTGWNAVLKLETTTTNAHPLLMFRHNGADTGYVGFGDGAATNGLGVYNYLNADLTLGTSSTTMMTFKPSGNIGIGTATPTYKLQVNGALSAGDAVSGNSEASYTPIFNHYIGGSGDIGSGSVAYILVAYNQSAGSGISASGFDGQIYSYRGSAGTWNNATQYDLAIKTAYDGMVVHRFNTYGPLNAVDVVSLTYSGTSYIAVRVPSSSSMDYYITGRYWSFKPILIDSVNHGASISSVVSLANPNLTTTSTGRVGIGTTSPSQRLHVSGNGAGAGNQTGIQVGDVGAGAGPLFLVHNNPNIAGNAYYNNAWNYAGGTGKPSTIDLANGISLITSNNTVGAAGTSVTDFSTKLFVAPGGNVGVGTTAPSEKLHVVGNLRVQGSTDCTLGNGAGGTNCSSDARLKENIRPIPYALDKVISLQGVEFDWNQKSLSYGRHDIGVIAQDVEKVFPTAVMTDKNSGYKKVDYAVLVAPVIQAIKELYIRITGQDRELASVKQEVSELRKENEALKAYLCAKDPTAPICK